MKSNSQNARCSAESLWTKNRFFSFRTYLGLFLLSFLNLSTTIAQNLPSPSRCTSKDLELVSATLTGGNACNTCTPGTTVTRTLTLGINNKTGSIRTSFSFWGTLEITHADGSVVTSAITRCSGPIPPTGPYPAAYTSGSFGTITYTCGDSLRIINLFLAWTAATDNASCPLNPSKIAPKCGTLPAIRVNVGVNAQFAVTNASCTSSGQIVVTCTGGTPPYTVANQSDVRTNVMTSATFTGLGVGTHSFTITDAANCSVSTSRDIIREGSLDPPTFCVVQPSLCSSAGGSVTILSPLGDYDYSIDNGAHWQTSTAFSGLAAGAVTGVKVRNGACESAAAACSSGSTCSINRTANDDPTVQPKTEENKSNINFDVFPVPFKDQLTIKYRFDYKTNVKIEIFNSQGVLILTKQDSNSYFGKEVKLDLKVNLDKNQVYVVKITTNKGSSIRKIISSK